MLWEFVELDLLPNGVVQERRRLSWDAATAEEAVRQALYTARLAHPEAQIAPSGRGVVIATLPDGTVHGWYLNGPCSS